MNAPRTVDLRSRRGWGTWLLLGVCGVAAAAMLTLISLSLIVPRAVDGAINRYTASKPLDLPKLLTDRDEREAIEGRIEAFGEDLEEGRATTPLILDEHELNVLAAGAVDGERLSGLHINLEPGRVRAHVSVPLHGTLPLGPWSRELTGRYLNGTATIDVAFRDERLNLHLAAFDVNGRALPNYLLDVVRDELAKQDLLADPAVQDALRRVDFVQIGQDRVVIGPQD